MRTTAFRTMVDIVVRAVAFLAGDWAYRHVYEWLVPPPDDADIGEGLIAFALMILVAAVWGVWDGHHRGPGLAVTIWVVAGVVAGGILAFGNGIGAPGNSLGLMLSDLADIGPFLVSLIVVPALVGVALTAGIRGASRPSPGRR